MHLLDSIVDATISKDVLHSATPGELLDYIRNIYYVLLTRGVMGTYVYACDEGLREYLGHYLGR
ncbi:MAG: DNA/RNA helicase domain-containing protein [Atopobiaceae bacterium]|jgi:DUF2075 family protein|nr:DUF2075 domain-containing protein [Atopobiaceae bacterium]